MKKIFLKVLSEVPKVEALSEEIVDEIVTLEERISELEIVLRKKVETCFSDVVTGAKDKVDVIISFLAMLEMIKQRVVRAEQEELFQDIRLSLHSRAEESFIAG